MVPAKSGGSELRLRIISALVLGVVAVSLTWFGGWAFTLMVGLLGILISREWLSLTATLLNKSGRDDVAGTLFFWALFILSMAFVFAGDPRSAVLWFVIGTVVLFLWTLAAKTEKWLAPGLIYAGLPMVALFSIRNHPSGEGLLLVFGLFAIVWATDIFAYFVGRRVGGAKLMPSVSPKKTWSGFFGGVAAAIIFAGIASFYIESVGFFLALAGGAILSIISQLGDLFESAIKRHFGVKDSGNIIPGHGGFMDRVDGLVFAAVAGALMLL